MLRRVASLLAILLLAASAAGAEAPPATIEVFTRDGCPHCADAKPFLDALAAERPSLRVVEHDVVRDPAALARLRRLADERGIAAVGVPAFLVGDTLVVGFDSAATTGARLRAALDAAEPSPIVLPLVGAVDPDALGLPLFTLALGLADGFNPCAMWVLLFLLSLLVNLRDRRKMLAIGGTFVVASAVVYFMFMAAWLNVFLVVGAGRPVEVVLGLVAAIVGAVNVKDFFAFGRGPSLSIPEAAKPGIYARVRRIVTAERLGAAVASAAVLAALANTVELLCTAGLPAVYTHVLARQGLPAWGHYAYLALYNVAYAFDDAVMVGIAVATLSRRKLQERAGRLLKLVSGLVMLGLAALLLFAPGVLGAPGG